MADKNKKTDDQPDASTANPESSTPNGLAVSQGAQKTFVALQRCTIGTLELNRGDEFTQQQAIDSLASSLPAKPSETDIQYNKYVITQKIRSHILLGVIQEKEA